MRASIWNILLITIVLALPFADDALADASMVRVLGQGESNYEARQDAVRQALQMSVEQLVLSQQIVENDQLTLDRITSTMNGFVTSFDVVRNWSDDGTFFLEADIGISQSRIENFIGAIGGQRTQVDSGHMFAAANAERLAARARAEIIMGLLQDLSPRALEITRSSFSVNRVNPAVIDYSYDVVWSETFKKSIVEGMVALGATRRECSVLRGRPGSLERQPDPRGIGGFRSACMQVAPFSTNICFAREITRAVVSSLVQDSVNREAVCYSLANVDNTIFGPTTDFYPGFANGSSGYGKTAPLFLYWGASFFDQDGRLMHSSLPRRHGKAKRAMASFRVSGRRSGQVFVNKYFVFAFGLRRTGDLPLKVFDGVSSVDSIPILTDSIGGANLVMNWLSKPIGHAVWGRNGSLIDRKPLERLRLEFIP